MNSNKNFLAIRYLTIVIIILGMTFIEFDSLTFFPIILTLIFAINTQLRYFLFRDKIVPVLLSIVLDFVIGYLLFMNYTDILLPFFIIGVMDSFFLIDNHSKYLLPLIGLIILIYLCKDFSMAQQLSYFSVYMAIGLTTHMAAYLKHKQNKMESLYQKLKKSEHELIKMNKDLEAYAESTKEITLLKERNRISREIHDSVGHSLSTIIIQLGAIERIAKENGESASLMTSNLRDFTKDGLEEIRKALKELKPKEFEDYEALLMIESLIKDFSDLTNIDVAFGFSKAKWKTNEETSLVIYRAIQEFLSNSSRHGKATKINIFLHFDDRSLILTMQDNGVGTDYINLGMGLTSLNERVKELGGEVNYKSSKDNGFLLRVVLNADKKSEGFYE